MRRFRDLEADAWQPGSDWVTDNMLTLIARNLASAERSFFRTLDALTKLQKARGFVPSKQPAPALHHVEFIAEDDPAFAEQTCLHQPAFHFVPATPHPAPPSRNHARAGSGLETAPKQP